MSRVALLANVGAMIALASLDARLSTDIELRAIDVTPTEELRELPKRLHPKYRANKYTPHIGKKQIEKNRRRALHSRSVEEPKE